MSTAPSRMKRMTAPTTTHWRETPVFSPMPPSRCRRRKVSREVAELSLGSIAHCERWERCSQAEPGSSHPSRTLMRCSCTADAAVACRVPSWQLPLAHPTAHFPHPAPGAAAAAVLEVLRLLQGE